MKLKKAPVNLSIEEDLIKAVDTYIANSRELNRSSLVSKLLIGHLRGKRIKLPTQLLIK